MRQYVPYVCAAMALLTSGCATMVHGTTQPVAIKATDAKSNELTGAKCSVQNDRGSVSVTTPATAIINRSDALLSVTCGADGFVSNTVSVPAHISGWAFAAGITSVAVDTSTGAAYYYPDSISVPLALASK